jgi:predicted permease
MRARLIEEDSRLGRQLPRIEPLSARIAGESPRLLYVLLGASGLLLLISCVNLATMLMASASRRQRELATRAALGSSRGRLVRQLLTENLTLAAFGGVGGMLLGMAAVAGLIRIAPAALPRTDNIVFDWRIFLAGCGLTLFTAFLFGLIPSVRASRVDLESALRESTRGGSAGVGRNRVYQVLIAAQVAMAVVVLIGAGLLTKSFGALLRNDLGMAPENVLVFEVSLPDAAYREGADRARFHRELHERLETLPGVTAAGAVSWLPSSGRYNIWGYSAAGQDSSEGADVRVVQGAYFGALDIGLLEGRYIDATDRADGAPVVVVSESLARRHWPDRSAVGETINISEATRTIVGVVRDARYDHRIASSPTVYIPHEQFAGDRNWALFQVVKTDGNPLALREAAAKEITALDPGLVMHHVRRLEEVVAAAIARDRFAMLLMSVFGWTSLLLAVVGVYGLLSYVVAQRTREIGIRLALGARPREILASVVGRALRVAAAGTAAGCVLAMLGTRWMESMLFEISPTDGAVFAGVIVAANVAVILACIGPAGRAVSVSPTTALRQE